MRVHRQDYDIQRGAVAFHVGFWTPDATIASCEAFPVDADLDTLVGFCRRVGISASTPSHRVIADGTVYNRRGL